MVPGTDSSVILQSN